MTEKPIKQTFKGSLAFNHIDPHFARFAINYDGKKGGSSVYGSRVFSITPDMFPADFDLASYDVSGTAVITVEIEKKK
jgi:hypothetical protein